MRIRAESPLKPDPSKGIRSSIVLLVWLLLDVSGCGVKFLGAFYSGSLLLAADGLYGLTVWFRFLSSGREETRIHPAVAVPIGLIIAAAGIGIAWRCVVALLAASGAVSAGVQAGSVHLTAPLVAAGVFAGKYLAGYLASRFFSFSEPHSSSFEFTLRDTGDLLYEQGFSRIVLFVLIWTAARGSSALTFDYLAAVPAGLISSAVAVMVVYHYVKVIFEKISSQDQSDS